MNNTRKLPRPHYGTMGDRQKLSVWLTESEKERVRMAADMRDLTLSEVIRDLIHKHL